jgi:hypothetical protein
MNGKQDKPDNVAQHRSITWPSLVAARALTLFHMVRRAAAAHDVHGGRPAATQHCHRQGVALAARDFRREAHTMAGWRMRMRLSVVTLGC